MSESGQHGEGQKLVVDVFKHMTTLITFSILLITIFLNKVFEEPVYTALIVWSLIGLILALLSSVGVMFLLAYSYLKAGNPDQWVTSVGIILIPMSLGGFVIGVSLLSLFAVFNV